jgi:dihydropyrimidinase
MRKPLVVMVGWTLLGVCLWLVSGLAEAQTPAALEDLQTKYRQALQEIDRLQSELNQAQHTIKQLQQQQADHLNPDVQAGPEYFYPSQPNILEVEALTRAATFSAITGCPLYPVHLSAGEIPPVLQHFRELDKAPLYAETCPQYLALSNDVTLQKGFLSKCGPPLRMKADNEALWTAVADGTSNTITSDNTGLASQQKLSGGMNREAPGTSSGSEPASVNTLQGAFGLNTIEFMVPVVWSHGVNTGRITLPRLVQVLCENPAKIFGIYPQKGTLQPGSDADLAIWDPAKRHTVTRQHGDADFSSFEGFELLGMPTLVMQRGQVIIENDQVVGSPGQGQFLSSDVNRAAYAPGGPQTA